MTLKDLSLTLSGTLSGFVLSMAAFLPLAEAKPLNVVAFGDSLMAGYQLDQDDAFPNRLDKALAAQGIKINMISASVSGDTTSSGLARLDWSIPDGTDVVILGLGANDALRGLPVNETRKNLNQMIIRLEEREINIFLMGMLAPPNMGDQYTENFNKIYPELAKQYQLELYPFFLDGIAGVQKLNLTDGKHPNPDGVTVLVKKIMPVAVRLFSALMNEKSR